MNTCIETLNRFGGQLSGFVWPMFWQSSLLIILIFALDFLLARKIRASVRYALWLAVLVKLLLPPTFAFPTGVSWWLFQPKMAIKAPATGNCAITYGAVTPQPDFISTTISLPRPAPPMLNSAGWMLLASGAVSAGLLLWLALRCWQVGRMVRRAAMSEEFSETIEAAGRLADWGPRVRLKLVERQMSPAVCGLVRPVVLLPRELAKTLSAPQLRAVVLHEIFHLRRMDVWVNCAQTFLQIVYWWHPLLWIANARIRRLREEAVDDAVMLALREESDSYAPTLLEVAKLALRRPLLSLGLVGILESRGALRQRIERLVEFRAPRKAGLTFASLCGIFAFSAVALPMGEAPAPAPADQQVEVKLAAPALPAVRESTNRVPVLVEAKFYEMPPGDFKDLVSGLQFKPGVKNEDSWWSASKENFSTLQTTLAKAGFHLLTKTRVQTRSGMPAELYDGNGTNGVWFNCMPTVEGNIVDLSVDGKVINGWQQVVSTNQFRATASAENDGGMVIRIDRMDGLETSNLVVVIGVQLITNTPPGHLQQRLQAVIKRADVANSLAAAGSTNQLFVRTFKVDTRAFIASLQQAGAAFGEETNSPAHIAMAVRKFIGGLGVNWDLPAGKSCFFNDRNGLLFVRATESDLDLVERAVQILDYTEPQIHIKARFFEVPMGTVANFGSLLASTNSTVNQFTRVLNSTNMTAALIALQSCSGSELLAEPEGTTINGRQMQMRATQLISVITNFEFQNGFPDTLVPQVGQMETGPVLDVIPHVLPDGYTINMTVIPSVTEFLGYANPSDVPNVTGTNNRVQLPVILPQFSKQVMTANLNLWDGQTVLIGGMTKANHFGHKVPVLGSIPLIGRFRTENDTTNEILVLITATIVDPAGKRVRADTEMPFAAAAVPPQPSP